MLCCPHLFDSLNKGHVLILFSKKIISYSFFSFIFPFFFFYCNFLLFSCFFFLLKKCSSYSLVYSNFWWIYEYSPNLLKFSTFEWFLYEVARIHLSSHSIRSYIHYLNAPYMGACEQENNCNSNNSRNVLPRNILKLFVQLFFLSVYFGTFFLSPLLSLFLYLPFYGLYMFILTGVDNCCYTVG